MNNPITGLHYFLAGLNLIMRPGLKRFVVIPMMINILVFVALFFLLRHFFIEFNTWFNQYLPVWLHWFSIVLWVLFFLSFFIIFLYLFAVLGNIIAAPFNSFLSEKIEIYLKGKSHIPPNSFSENLKAIPKSIGRQLVIIVYYVPRALLLLICFFIPIIQVIAPLLWILFNAWFLTITYLDYPTENHRVSIQNLRLWLREKNWIAIGFGLSVLLMTIIPIVNFFVIPAAVAGATKFWVEENE